LIEEIILQVQQALRKWLEAISAASPAIEMRQYNVQGRGEEAEESAVRRGEAKAAIRAG